MSSGTEKATDFRPGQWSPRLPNSIKHTINRSGGFGVNGFYLPMNDSSNPGADFHCAPNSIIKLKGEDLPQPRNGVPTTSDAYVSQLRTQTGELFNDGVVNFTSTNRNALQDSGDAINFGTGEFTVEAFVYHTGIPQNSLQYIFMNTAQQNTNTFAFAVESDRIVAGVYAGSFSNSTKVEATFPAGSLKVGQWYHYAACRSGNTLRLFIDGKMMVEDTSHTENYNNTSAFGCRVGCESGAGATVAGFKAIKGFISNVRVVNGTALYTSNFTPPTSALTAVNNTVLLCCQSPSSPTAAAVSPGTLSVLTEGDGLTAARNELDASIILACPFVAGGFGQNGAENTTIPGLGDYHIALGGPSYIPAVNWLIASGNQAKITGDKGLYYGSSLDVTNNSICPRATVGTAFTPDGDYTVEFWCYINSFDSVGSHVIQYDKDDGSTGWLVSVDGGTLRWMLRNSSNQDVQVSIPNVVKLGQWNHIACVYETTPKDRMTAWVNGVSVGTTAVTSNYLSTQHTNLNRLHIGSNGGDGSRPMLGYLQDLRIYKGVAKYKGGFDVPKPYTPVGIEPFRTSADTCKNNFATLNPIFGIGRQDQLTYTNGNLTVTSGATGGSDTTAVSNTAIKDKVYCEFYLPSDAIGVYVGAAKYNTPFAGGIDTTASSDCWLVRGDTGNKANGESGTGLSYGGSFSNGDVIMMAADIENGSIWWGRNGSWTASGNPATNSNAAYTNLPSTEDLLVMCGDNYSDKVPSIHVNFGQNQTFTNLKAVNKNRVNNGTGNDVWHQSSNGGTHVDWTASAGGTQLDVAVPNNNYARAWLLATDGTIDPKKTYLVSFDYVTGPANLGVQNDHGYMTAVDGSVSPNGLSSGNSYSFVVQGTREFNFTGFSGSTYSLQNIVVSEIDECYTDTSGKGKFHYEPPTGFLALCADNLPAPAIADPGKHFKCVLYKGSGTSRGITGVGFKPDLVWVKSRTNTEGHILFDSVRGPELRQLVHVNTTEGLVTNGGLMSFDDDGFSVGQYTGTNQSGQDYVAWCWKAGGAAVANTDGTIASQVSVNQTAGFSCGTFTGNLQANQSIGHGLGKVPAMVVVKERNASSGWGVYHKARGNTKVSYWDIPNTEFTETNSSASWGPTDPTSDVFYVGVNGATNDNNLAFYAWAEIEGYSKFGSYVGNSDDDGPAIFCGFKPAFLMIKLVTGSQRDWHIYDSSRNPTNPVGLNLRPSTDAGEIDEPGIDFLSNGFKIRKDYVFSNESGQTIIFAAFAESPFQTANSK